MAVPSDLVSDLPRDVALCECHGKPCYWQKDRRMTAGGRWECRVKREVYNRTRSTDPERSARVRAQGRDYWHRPGGGYFQERRRDLAGQRALILEQLDQLAQEAASAES